MIEAGPEEKRLSTKEQTILHTLLDPANKIEVTINDELDGSTLVNYLGICCKAVNYMRRTTDRIRPIIGRLLILISDHPSIYKDRGYPSFEQFLKGYVRDTYDLSRTDVFEAMKVCKAFPHMTLAQAEKIGSTKLSLVARVTNETAIGHQRWLKRAVELTADQLRIELEQKKLIDKGESQGAVIVINCNRAQASVWKEFVNTPEVLAWGGPTPADVLISLMQECHNEWLVRGRERLDEGRSQGDEHGNDDAGDPGPAPDGDASVSDSSRSETATV
jgi:hypothetical protein